MAERGRSWSRVAKATRRIKYGAECREFCAVYGQDGSLSPPQFCPPSLPRQPLALSRSRELLADAGVIASAKSSEVQQTVDIVAPTLARLRELNSTPIPVGDIEVDFAPAVDVRGEAAPKGLERRTFGDDPETVTELAGAFMRGLHASGTASCPKHCALRCVATPTRRFA